MKNKILVLLVLILLIIPFNKAKAQTVQDMYNDLAALEKSYSEAKNKQAMTQTQLNNIRKEIATAENDITNTKKEIETAENKIKESEDEIETKKDETDKMLLYLQLTNNEDSYLEYLFEAEDYTDFIYRYSIVTQLGDYNTKLMNELSKMISELQTQKNTLSQKQNELEEKKQALQSKYAIIQIQYKDEQDDGISIQEQISEQRKLIKVWESKCNGNRNKDINTCKSVAAVDGWTYPVKSFWQSSNYAEPRTSCSRSGCKTVYHYAVDLALAEGHNVYAVANGEVTSVRTSTCGGMVIQIKHNYNGTYYTSLYMHLLEGYVKVGDEVSGGKVIGLSGGGPREIAKWGDVCTEGAHLHFSMAYGSSLIGSSSSIGSTFNPVKFFPGMNGIGSSM